MPYVELVTTPTDPPVWQITEAVTRVGTAAYRAYTAAFRQIVNDVYFDRTGYARIYADNRLRQVISTYWPQAWADGIKEFGLTMADLTGEELLAYRAGIAAQQGAVAGFVEWLTQHQASRAVPFQDERRRLKPEALWRREAANHPWYGQIENRMRLWWNAYHGVENQARQLAAGDRPMRWDLGRTEQHCNDCATYDGRVYRASTWARYDIRPQHTSLSCHGYNCLCRLRVTDEPVTPGKPPRMTG